MKAEIVQLGSLYFDDSPQATGCSSKENNSPLEIHRTRTLAGQDFLWSAFLISLPTLNLPSLHTIPNRNNFGGIHMGKIIMGSVFYRGEPVQAGFSCDEFTKFAFGDTVPGFGLLWVPYRDVLIADRCICRNVSWDQLDQSGLIFGTKIKIDGRPYLCRCLMNGEWDEALDVLGEKQNLWNWCFHCFWTQTVYPTKEPNCEIRGGNSARYQDSSDPLVRNTYIGFRPVLEPLIAELSEDLIGSNIKVFLLNQNGPYKNRKVLVGQLTGFDSYDLVLETNDEIPAGCKWAARHGHEVVITRGTIAEIGEATNGKL